MEYRTLQCHGLYTSITRVGGPFHSEKRLAVLMVPGPNAVRALALHVRPGTQVVLVHVHVLHCTVSQYSLRWLVTMYYYGVIS